MKTKKFKLLWSTDIHVNFCSEQKINDFCAQMRTAKPDAIVITGDIAESQNVCVYLAHMDLQLNAQCPTFFVLGNHDYYNSSIKEVRETVSGLFTYPEEFKKNLVPRLGWLNTSGVIPLTEKTALVGHDGWYDGLYADFYNSRVDLNDYYIIEELSQNTCKSKMARHQKLQELAQEAAVYVREQLNQAFKTHEHVFVATHVAPFIENSVYNGKVSDDNWLPHFSSKIMGDMLRDIAAQNPTKKITVLCGHSHGSANNQITQNMKCITGYAKYRFPGVNAVFEVE